MLFRLESSDKGTSTHSGVLEFTAEEGSCYIPFWMMQNLLIEEGSVISVTNVSLPKATFVKLQPQHVDFLEITNPRAVLEHALRNFSCVTKGDVICLPFNSKNYHFELKEVKPKDAACIIETDCNVDFDAPVGYKEPERPGFDNVSGTGDSANGSPASSLANFPKQSAYAERNSACPSPALSSMSGTSGNANSGKDADSAPEPLKTRIVDGKICRPEDTSMASQGSGVVDGDATMMADKTGGTGVQDNAAIAVQAPTIGYWAVNAGDGARLDGKKPSVLKDKEGNEVDIRKLRAEAAARRLEKINATKNLPEAAVGLTVSGKTVPIQDESMKPPVAPVSKRKSRIGSKYSKLKQGGVAFGGSAKKL
jgi:ubiquitin fusion degradation protein 1